MATCAQLQTWLADAEERYHALQSGQVVEQIVSGEKQLRYSAADSDKLLKYIQSLRAQVEACTGVADTGQRAILRIVPR